MSEPMPKLRADLLPFIQSIFGRSAVAIYAAADVNIVEANPKGGIEQPFLCFDSRDVVIEFKDGRKVRIWNSEWGGIEAA